SHAADKLPLFDNGEAAVKIVLPKKASAGERDIARELAKFLDESSGARFEIVPEGEAAKGVFVGKTDLATTWGLTKKDTGDEGYVIAVRSGEGKAAIVGGSDMATKFAVYDFLYRFVGCRWFLPGELFQIVPKHTSLAVEDCEIVEKPAFSPRAYSHIRRGRSPCYPGNQDPQYGSERWGLRNRISADGRGQPRYFSHNLYRIIDFRKYGKTHPDYFPLRRGKRFIPESFREQNWQPCTTNPDVIRLTIEFGRKFFKENPERWKWFSLGINDGGGWCECERCKALDVPGRTFRRRKFIASDRYYHFVTIVANALLKEFPDRKIGVIAYASVEPKPEKIDKLPPNVCVYITHDSSQYHDWGYRDKDLEFDRIWKKVCNNNLYRYDYYGLTWFVPRFFPHIIAEDARRMKKMDIHGIFAEECPAWPTVGPMLYSAARILWNPDENYEDHLRDFYRTCFGKAEDPMKDFWERQKNIWEKDRDGRWFEGLNDLRAQVALYSKDDVDYCDRQFDQALSAAGNDMVIRQRVEFFKVGWDFAAGYIRESHLLKELDKEDSPEKAARIATKVLLSMDKRHKFWDEFKQRKTFLSESYVWFLDGLHRDGFWEMRTQKAAQSALASAAMELGRTKPGMIKEIIGQLEAANAGADVIEGLRVARSLTTGNRPPNLLKNPDFAPDEGAHPEGLDWSARGAPAGWSTWKLKTGKFRFKDGVASVRGTDNGVVIQCVPVKPGEKVIATARYRMRPGPPATGLMTIRWKGADGGWLVSTKKKRQGIHMVTVDCKKSDHWRDVFAYTTVPDGAAQAVFMLGAKDQKKDDVIEFKEPYLGRRLEPQMNADGHGCVLGCHAQTCFERVLAGATSTLATHGMTVLNVEAASCRFMKNQEGSSTLAPRSNSL
ncbi:MAG: DUF4838 domain-containing protein, partial [Planctomycetes bacterium]|nr:DUF4838 domain-containing protein [Planctomycetota bacterium]